jgi:hypothetical protein
MILAQMLPLPVAKEVRALLSLWLGCLALVGAGAAVSDASLHSFGILIYCAGCVTLGALAIGHEYTHRTLPLLLCQPVSRARILLVKLLVLAVMLLVLAGVAWGSVFYASSATAMIVVVSVLCGLFVAPWLTMLCRNAFAGAVFTIPIAGWTWFLVDLFVAQPLKVVVFQRSMVGLCAVAAVLGWRTFMRLEAIEGRGTDVQLPIAAGRLTASRTRHPIWLLAKKELGLQQLTLAVAAIYVLSWWALLLAGRVTTLSPRRGTVEDVMAALSVFYSGILALVIGSLASAEERQFGTLEWQLLLPVASWKQWLVKVGVVLGLAMLLLVGLPALVLAGAIGHHDNTLWYVCAILLLTCGSLYVSSLNTSGLKAFLLSVPVSLVALAVMAAVSSMLELRRLSPAPLVLFGGFLAIVLYLALVNHRSTERGAWRVGRQVFVMAGCLALAGAVLAVL